ncbi:MAG: GAF domain-containing protein [Anaerolineales bacterium]
MLNQFLNFFRDPEDQDPSFIRLTRNIVLVVLIGTLVILVMVTGSIPGTIYNPTAIIAVSGIVLLEIISLILVLQKKLGMAKFMVPAGLLAAITTISINGLGLHDTSIMAFSVVIVISTLLLRDKARYFSTPLTLLAIEFIVYADLSGINNTIYAERTDIDDAFITGVLILVSTELLQMLIRRLNESIQRAQANEQMQIEANRELRNLQVSLEQRVAERTAELDSLNQRNQNRAKQFEAVAQVARSISSTQNSEILLPKITTLISQEFGFYHVGIFLLDTRREYAVLSASNSEGGQRMLERNHRLLVGETGIVGYVTSTGKARVALDTGTDAVFFNNPDLPETRSEIALPLRIGEEVIGALDVQSTEPNALNDDDISVLGTLADQVSVAIQNARQYERTRKALIESESLSRQFVQSGWSNFTKTENILGIRHTGAKATLLYRKNKRNKTDDHEIPHSEQSRTNARGTSLSLPIKLRGEVIGSVAVRSAANRQFDQDELDIVTAIIERAAIAMENARLLAESQKRAAKERTIGEIAAKISAQSDVDELLKTAVQELNRTLPGVEIAIQMQQATETGNV